MPHETPRPAPRPDDGDTASASHFGGKDDKVFRLDRVDNAECAELLPKPKQTASFQRK
jgi:hypothetical protein